jgi:cell division protease FtsH
MGTGQGMTKQKPEEKPAAGSETAGGRRNPRWLPIFLILAAVFGLLFFSSTQRASTVSYSFFLSQLDQGNVVSLDIGDRSATGTFRVPPEKPASRLPTGEVVPPRKGTDGTPEKYDSRFTVMLPAEGNVRSELFARLDALRREATAAGELPLEYRSTPGDLGQTLLFLLMLALPISLLVLLFIFFRRTREQLMGGGFLSSFSRSTAKRYEPTDRLVTFRDVAGLEGVKADLQEIVDYLSGPEKFQKLGGRVPKGVLLNGPPGTGKTLLARAVAGEAGVAFYSVSGSEFIQMFVGVGASRVRDLFQTAKENGPAIIFIDEIDAVGRQRGAGLGGGHDEREQTLNQILSEMDGFSPSDSVIVMAATNRPDVLDPALLRPGRFDRHITVGRPTLKGRKEIFKVHVRDVPLADDVDLHRLAEATVGLTGADIRNIVNEAALWAARQDKTQVAMEDFDYARDKVLMGAKREEVMAPDEKVKTAYHEAGHTLGAWFLPGAQRVHKVTIIPRGRSLGSTQIVPSEDRLSMSESELRDQLVVLLAGRAAERIVYSETTVGAENDLERATSLARRMVSHWGMSPKLGPVSYKTSEEDPFLGREIHQQRHFSEHTQELIDEEVGILLAEADRRAEQLLSHKREELECLRASLLEREELNEAEITELIGASVHADKQRARLEAEAAAAEGLGASGAEGTHSDMEQRHAGGVELAKAGESQAPVAGGESAGPSAERS